MTPEQIAEAKRLCEAAREWPVWESCRIPDQMVFCENGIDSEEREVGWVAGLETLGNGGEGFMLPDVADYVALSRTLLPQAPSALETAEREKGELREDLEEYGAHHEGCDGDDRRGVCSCGLSAALSRTPATPAKGLPPELKEVVGWAGALLTALNIGDVARESLIHKKLREVMFAYRASLETDDE